MELKFRGQNLNISYDLKLAMNAAAKASKYSREQILERMEESCRRHGIKTQISMALLEKWLNPQADEHVMPLKLFPVFCRAVDCDCTELLSILIRPLGYRAIDQQQDKLLTWAEAYHEAKMAKQKLKKMEDSL
ncbi:hypothetical protein [Desulforegula conservatrix]|uniref:hypothetical protein n=1 Tax=Desulforegula conservatrix TaxID=153026 RepID=UPI0004292673|nr:hypothetical protein [Desulforegula conservatrix]